MIQISCVFYFYFLSTLFAAFSKKTNVKKRLSQKHNNLTRVRFELKSCDQDRRKHDAFDLSAIADIAFTYWPHLCPLVHAVKNTYRYLSALPRCRLIQSNKRADYFRLEPGSKQKI